MRATIIATIGAVCLLSGASGETHEATHHVQPGRRVRVNPTPILEIGSPIDGRGVLGNVTAAVLLGRNLVVMDDARRRIVSYAPNGQPLRSIEQADRPQYGQFKQMTWMGRCAPNNLFVLDASMKRVTVLDTAMKPLRVFRPPAFAARWSCSEQAGIATLLLPGAGVRRTGGQVETRAPIVFLDAQGRVVSSSEDISAGDGLFAGVVTSIAMSTSRLYVGYGDSTLVDILDRNAKRTGVLRIGALRHREMTDAEFTKIVRRQLGASWPDSIVKRVLGLPRPRLHPLYRDVKASPDGTVWLTVSRASEDSTTFRALSSTGVLIGEVRLPHVAQILEAGDDYLVTKYTAKDGHERVALFHVERS